MYFYFLNIIPMVHCEVRVYVHFTTPIFVSMETQNPCKTGNMQNVSYDEWYNFITMLNDLEGSFV